MKKVKFFINQILSVGTIGVIAMIAACGDDKGNETGAPALTDTITEDIETNTVLEDLGTGVDYYICSYIYVEAGLTIKPNVTIVMCAGSFIDVTSNGYLNAVGTADSPIIIKGEVGTKGYWDAININSNNPKNHISYVTISDGGGKNSYDNASIWVNNNNNAQLTIDNTTIANSKAMGVYVEDGSSLPNFSNNNFKNNGGVPLVIPLSIIGALDSQSDYSDGNANNYIKVTSADLNQDATVAPTNVPYLISGYQTINSGLTLQPGVKFLMDANAQIDVSSSGFFKAIGTASNPIIITGKTQAVGYWEVIEINSNNPNNTFEYVSLSYGGGVASFDYSTIWVNDNNNGQFTIQNCTISDSYGWGIYVEDNASITPSTVSAIESANTFTNNGTGTSSNCTGNCNVYIQP